MGASRARSGSFARPLDVERVALVLADEEGNVLAANPLALKHTWATLEKTVAALERALAAAQTWKGIALQREEAHEEALAGWKEALDDAELDRTLDSLRAIFDDIAPRLFPWELAAFATHATETVARLVPSRS
jgi:hypothetical protein